MSTDDTMPDMTGNILDAAKEAVPMADSDPRSDPPELSLPDGPSEDKWRSRVGENMVRSIEHDAREIAEMLAAIIWSHLPDVIGKPAPGGGGWLFHTHHPRPFVEFGNGRFRISFALEDLPWQEIAILLPLVKEEYAKVFKGDSMPEGEAAGAMPPEPCPDPFGFNRFARGPSPELREAMAGDGLRFDWETGERTDPMLETSRQPHKDERVSTLEEASLTLKRNPQQPPDIPRIYRDMDASDVSMDDSTDSADSTDSTDSTDSSDSTGSSEGSN